MLDRLFVQDEWLTVLPTLKVSLLQRGLSDHCPLLMTSMDRDWGPKPFRFQNCWLSDPNCIKIIQQAWLDSSSPSLLGKLKGVKARLKSWNSTVFGKIDTKIYDMEQLINDLDEISNHRNLDQAELLKKKEAQAELWEWAKRKEIYWAQQSRIQRLKSGDLNTKFFHMVASNRRRRNNIGSIKINGSIKSDPKEIKTGANDFFTSIFHEKHQARPVFDGLSFNQLSQEQSDALTAHLSTTEIDQAWPPCNPDKAPGPDGFNFKFIKASWEIIKHDIYSAIQEFWTSCKLPPAATPPSSP
ncbi:uncharacterized protein LOC130591042 [Beta vulgaris subsp. vulgaris]|uniref:uncharacterized protein LOC130591042 n=1 Tax=Beta vulgaris subsp. vulgaris TaxID=3555 RepID=UPI0025465BEE|nr:uncharacterized protein LOC130591042 [Beta vulgaris subsp. vulgaris]